MRPPRRSPAESILDTMSVEEVENPGDDGSPLHPDWDAELEARLQALDEGHETARPAGEVLAEIKLALEKK